MMIKISSDSDAEHQDVLNTEIEAKNGFKKFEPEIRTDSEAANISHLGV